MNASRLAPRLGSPVLAPCLRFATRAVKFLGAMIGANIGVIMAVPGGAHAQGTLPTIEQIQASYNAHKGEFDYLLGDWEFTGRNANGPIRGRWSAVKLPETGQILDEFRVLSDSGQTYFVSTTLRAYDAVRQRWELVSVNNRGSGLHDAGTGYREGADMRVEQAFGAGTPEHWISRIRYHDIQPDRFSWTADRSTDGGKTWIANSQRIEARRIGPPRSLAPLTARGGPTGSRP